MNNPKEEIEQIKKIFEEIKFEEKSKKVKIIWDGIQYSVRIPKKFVEIIELNTNKDEFEFLIKGSKENPELIGRLIKNAK